MRDEPSGGFFSVANSESCVACGEQHEREKSNTLRARKIENSVHLDVNVLFWGVHENCVCVFPACAFACVCVCMSSPTGNAARIV